MEIIIRKRWTGDPIYTARDVENVLQALNEAMGAGADLRRADLRGANLYGANLSEANLREADLYGANLYGANLRGADLYGADLYGADLRRADLYGADLRRADLREANLRGANLYGANLRGADLYGANLRGADLYGADLYGADLRRANLYGADLRRADLREANLSEAKGIKGILNIGPIGSRNSYLTVIRKEDLDIEIRTGCFQGSIAEFKASVKATHDGNRHGQNYTAAIALIEAYRWDDAKKEAEGRQP